MKRLAFLLLGACAPAVAPLVEQHHAREALCAIGNVPAEDERTIRDGLERDLDARVSVEWIDVGDPEVRGVNVRVATNALPIDRLDASASSTTPGVVSGDRWSLAELVTHETLPSSRTVGPSEAEGVFFGILAIATVGILRIEPSGARTEYPSEGETRRAAPRASALADRLKSNCAHPATEGVAIRCTFAFAVKNDAPKPAAVDLELTLRAQPPRREGCTLTKRVRVDLESEQTTTGAQKTSFVVDRDSVQPAH